MQVYFYPKQSKGITLSWTLYVKIIINGEVSELSSGLKVNPDTWDKDNDIMEFTHNIRKKLIRVHNSLVSENSAITPSAIRDAYSNKNIEIHTIMVELSRMIERCKTEVKLGDSSKSSLQRHHAFSRHLQIFLLSKGLTDVTFDQVTVSFLQELEMYFKTKVCGHNTTKKQMDIMKKLYHYAKANGWTTKEPFYFYKITEKVVKKEALTEDELSRIIHKNLIQRLDKVRSTGYLVAQDTYYVGTIKGVGRIYQQTVIDTYSRVAFAKLYTSKHAITSADVLNDRVIPFFDQYEIPVLRMLTDRGTEFNGRPENHEYELYLQIENIDHSRTKVRHPQSNGICERLHRTMQDEFYAVTFRRKLYQTLEALQTDLDEWMLHYNQERTHSGRYCFGKTPFETFLESLTLAKDKQLNHTSTAA